MAAEITEAEITEAKKTKAKKAKAKKTRGSMPVTVVSCHDRCVCF